MTGQLQLILCGAPTLRLGEQSLAGLLSGKTLALFIFLAVTGRPHHRDALANLLWSDLPLPQARANLRYLLPDLRQVVGDYLLITPQTIGFNRTAPYWLDVEAAQTTLTAPHHTFSQAEIQAALALLQNEFLAGFQVRNASAFMNWVAEQRHTLQGLMQQAQQALLPPSHNLPGQLTPFLGREQEIGEILHFLHSADYRLLSIIGEGGVGKTRLALAVAQGIVDLRFTIYDSGSLPADQQKVQSQNRLTEQAPLRREQLEFPDGVWFVSLVGVTATVDLANQLAMVIGQEIGFTFSGQSAPTTQLFQYLATKRLLLILDNFEQLCDDPTFVIELLQKTRAVRLLVTSRRRLNIQAEYPWFITGLPLPCLETAATLTPAELLQFAGIALFVERARRAQPDFAINGANQAAIIQICQAIHGLPLGIELAAALGREYTCSELLAALYQDYTILATALPDFADRHRSIKRVIDRSWHFLKVEERTVLSRCAIFRGCFDLEAAAVVAGATPALLTRLYDQSLLHLAGEVAGCRYFVLHELVRQYAIEQLAPVALQQVREQHATYFMTKLQQVEATIRHQGVNQQLLHCDLDNIRTAWEWSVTQGPLCLLEQGAGTLARFYRMVGFHQEAYHAFQAAIIAVRRSTCPAPQQARLLADLLNFTGEFCRYLDRLAEAEVLVQEALQLAEQLPDTALRGWSHHELALIAQRRHQHTAMRTLAQKAHDLAEKTDDARLQALCSNALAVSEIFCGNLVAAIAYYHKGLRHLQQTPDRELEATISANLGGAYKRNREYTPAVEYLARAIALAESIHDNYGVTITHVLLGNLWLELGVYERAQASFTQALHSLGNFHDPYWEAWGRTSQAHLWQLCGDPAAAAKECRRVLPLVQDRMPLFEHRTLTYLADALCTLGEANKGEQLYWCALTLQQEANLQFRLAEPVIRLASLLLVRQETKTAQRLLEEPLARLLQQGPAAIAEPFALYLVSYHVFKANGDRRAKLILQKAHTVLQASANKINERVLRCSFLENVPARRELLSLMRDDPMTG